MLFYIHKTSVTLLFGEIITAPAKIAIYRKWDDRIIVEQSLILKPSTLLHLINALN